MGNRQFGPIFLLLLAAGCSSYKSAKYPTPAAASSPGSGGAADIRQSSKDATESLKTTISVYYLTVIDPLKLALLASQPANLTIDGAIQTPLDHSTGGKTSCSARNPEDRPATEESLSSRSLTIRTYEEKTVPGHAGPERTLALSFFETGLALECVKRTDPDAAFTWTDLQSALSGIVRIDPRPPENGPPPGGTPRPAADADGNCTPELQESLNRATSRALRHAQRIFDLNILALGSSTEGESARLEREMQMEGRSIIQMCDRMNTAWGDFSCKTEGSEGSEVILDTSSIKLTCDQARAQFR